MAPVGPRKRVNARIGQKNKITRRWARRGTRPRAPHDQRTQWAYIFGAICPAKGKGAGLVMPYCDTQAMQAHLAEISAMVEPGAHAVVILDQAGWHTAGPFWSDGPECSKVLRKVSSCSCSSQGPLLITRPVEPCSGAEAMR